MLSEWRYRRKERYFTFVVSAGYGCDTFTGSGAYIGGVYDGKGKWFGSGYIGAFDTATVTSQAAAGKGSVCACVIPGEQNGPTYYTYGIPSTSLYESSEGNLKRCFSDSPSSYNSNCQKTDYVTGGGSTPGCSCMYYTFEAGRTYILKANSCTRYTRWYYIRIFTLSQKLLTWMRAIVLKAKSNNPPLLRDKRGGYGFYNFK